MITKNDEFYLIIYVDGFHEIWSQQEADNINRDYIDFNMLAQTNSA